MSSELEAAAEHLKSMAIHYDDDTTDDELFEAAVAYVRALKGEPASGEPTDPTLSPSLTWTKDKPKVSGFYLCRVHENRFMAHVFEHLGELWFDLSDQNHGPSDKGLEWAGPIPDPGPGIQGEGADHGN